MYWSAAQERYVGEVTLGRDDRGLRIRKVLVGPRGAKGEEARLGVKDRVEQELRRRPAVKRGQISSRETLGEYLDKWIVGKKLSASAAANYEWAIEQHIRPALGTTRLRDLDRRRVRAFFSNLPTLGDGGKAKVYTVLRSALNDAVDEYELILVNPAARLKLEKERRRAEIVAWTPEEARRFLKAAKTSEHFPLFLVMLVGALGPAEAFGIRWKDVDLLNGRIAIIANLTEVEGRLVPGKTKTVERQRSIVLPAKVLRALKARHNKSNPAPSDYVFTAPQGGGIRRTTFRSRVFVPLLKKAKVPSITLYGLRHSSASLMAAMDIPLLKASRALGHSDIRTTANVYSHLFPETQREIAAKFDDFLREV
ncbi:MAG TPA: site-specific integrase [Candidatus Cybelea sp.]